MANSCQSYLKISTKLKFLLKTYIDIYVFYEFDIFKQIYIELINSMRKYY